VEPTPARRLERKEPSNKKKTKKKKKETIHSMIARGLDAELYSFKKNLDNFMKNQSTIKYAAFMDLAAIRNYDKRQHGKKVDKKKAQQYEVDLLAAAQLQVDFDSGRIRA
jgi:hypothetical protein